MNGLAIRLYMIETHYRKPKDFRFDELASSAKTLSRWNRKAVPNDGPVPEVVVAALCDDLNTPLAIAEMHKLAKAGDGEGLYASMKLLGLVE